MDDELLDLVDKDDKVIGTVWKSVSQGNPQLIYRAVAMAVFNDQKEVLLQQRSYKKTYDPGVWRLAASGHVGAGELPEEAATREVFEEIGINVKPHFYKKTLLNVSGREGLVLPRIFYVYYAILDNEPKFEINKTEVESVKWVSIKDLSKFAKVNDYDLNDFTHKTIVELATILKII